MNNLNADQVNKKVTTLREAIADGLPRYFTGLPCNHGHIAERYSNNRACSECVRAINRRPGSVAKLKKWYHSHTHQEKMLMWAKYRHKHGNYDEQFDLTVESLEWPEICPALGIRLLYAAQRSRNADNAPTLDRKNPRRGYVKNNVQVLSRRANRIKNDGTPEEIMRVALFVREMK